MRRPNDARERTTLRAMASIVARARENVERRAPRQR